MPNFYWWSQPRALVSVIEMKFVSHQMSHIPLPDTMQRIHGMRDVSRPH